MDCIPVGGGADRNESASQLANLAIALLGLNVGVTERVWLLLKSSPDPRIRSFIIDRLALLGCDPAMLLARLEMEKDDSIRAALWLGLGHYDDKSLPESKRSAILPKLVDVYRQDESAAVHAAVNWLMDKWGMRGDVRPSGDQKLVVGDFDKGKQWYVNSIGQTMVRITGPVNFQMGPQPGEPADKKFEKRHEVQIGYSYDIGMTKVTVGQFRRFLKDRQRPEDATRYAHLADAADDVPATRVSWYDAAEFCNWLSKRDNNIPPNQLCYEPNEFGKFDNGMKIPPQFTHKTGYRLPTEAEWEYACRGGATTMRCYGDADELLPRYAWYIANSGNDSLLGPVAKLLPNAYGLFDMHGNAMEWCQDVFIEDYRTNSDAVVVHSSDFMSVRGGRTTSDTRGIRSAKRFGDRPMFDDSGGFRIARSRP